jgi:hypothetical protein
MFERLKKWIWKQEKLDDDSLEATNAALNKLVGEQETLIESLKNESTLVLTAITLKCGGEVVLTQDWIDAAAYGGFALRIEAGDTEVRLHLEKEEECE